MTVEQAVKLGTVAARQPRSLRHIPLRDLEDPGEIFPLERTPRFIEGRERRGCAVERLAHERRRDDVCGSERNGLLDHIQQLAYVAGPRRGDEHLHRLW